MERRTTAPPARLRRVLRAALVVTLAAGAGLCLSELAIGAVRGFAFPYLNLFQADARYGVRLLPNASTRTRSRTGRVTHVRTNTLGFRGADFPEAPGLPAGVAVPGRVLLLGDSQAFGYGVDESDALAARLASRTGAEVLCAAVPTWGPTEYALAAAELVPRFRPEHVIFVGNLANDWFEAKVPNTRRTTARYGWAERVRAQAAQPVGSARSAADFPGKDLLMSRSQLVFLTRELSIVLREGGLPPNVAAEHLAKQAGRLREKGSAGPRTPLAPQLAAVRDTCARHGCRVLTVALPLDVMVDPAEQAKYATPARNLAGAHALLTDLLTDSARLGVPALNTNPALRAASPGAFLDDDYHLSARGHDAIAAALVPYLTSARASQPAPKQAGARHARL